MLERCPLPQLKMEADLSTKSERTVRVSWLFLPRLLRSELDASLNVLSQILKHWGEYVSVMAVSYWDGPRAALG